MSKASYVPAHTHLLSPYKGKKIIKKAASRLTRNTLNRPKS